MATTAAQVSASDTSDLNTVAANFKEFYSEDKVFEDIWNVNPTLTRIAKMSELSGDYYAVSYIYGGSAGTSRNYQNALGNQSPLKQVTTHVPTAEVWHIGTIASKAIVASRNKRGAFEPLVASHFQTGTKLAANLVSQAILSSGTATLGEISAIQANPGGFATGTAKVSLRDNVSYRNFEFGGIYDVTASDGSAPLGAPDTVQVLSIDAAAGYLVFSAPINSTTGNASGSWGAGYWIVGASLIRDGDYQANSFGQQISTGTGIDGFQPQQVAGFGAWNPSYEFRQSPGLAASNFFNLPRVNDGTRLAGQSYPGANMNIVDALINAQVQSTSLSQDGMGQEYCVLGSNSFAALQRQMQGQKLYVDDLVEGKIAYKVLLLQGGTRDMKVYMDPSMPPRRAYLWSPDDYEMVSMGACPAPQPYDDGRMVNSYTTQNGVQFRCGGYFNVVLKKPSNVCNVTLQQ